MTVEDQLICDECHSNIESLGEPCLDMIYMICHHTKLKHLVLYDDRKSERWVRTTAQFLEKKGYLISTDRKEEIIVRPSPHSWNESKQFYCWCKGEIRL